MCHSVGPSIASYILAEVKQIGWQRNLDGLCDINSEEKKGNSRSSIELDIRIISGLPNSQTCIDAEFRDRPERDRVETSHNTIALGV